MTVLPAQRHQPGAQADEHQEKTDQSPQSRNGTQRSRNRQHQHQGQKTHTHAQGLFRLAVEDQIADCQRAQATLPATLNSPVLRLRCEVARCYLHTYRNAGLWPIGVRGDGVQHRLQRHASFSTGFSTPVHTSHELAITKQQQ